MIRLYNYIISNDLSAAFLPKAIQKVSASSKRNKIFKDLNPRAYTLKKHNLHLDGPMYKWFKNIRDKYSWMEVLN